MITIILHGYLKDLWTGGPVSFEARTASEAIKAFCLQTKAFNVLPTQQPHSIMVADFETQTKLLSRIEEDTELHLYPAFIGGKMGGWTQILIGTALVAAATVTFAIGGPAWVGIAATVAFNLGTSLIIGGVIQLLSPVPKNSTSRDEGSLYLGPAENTTESGTRIPIVYGEVMVFGHILSADVDAVDIND